MTTYAQSLEAEGQTSDIVRAKILQASPAASTALRMSWHTRVSVAEPLSKEGGSMEPTPQGDA